MKKERKLKVGEKGFGATWFAKLFFTLISVKVWGLVAGTIVSTWLLMKHLQNPPDVIDGKMIEYGINGAQWVTFNTTVWALIFGMKGIFRISEQRDYAEQASIEEELQTKEKIANMLAKSEPEKQAQYPRGKYEVVGSEPENQ